MLIIGRRGEGSYKSRGVERVCGQRDPSPALVQRSMSGLANVVELRTVQEQR